MLVYRITLARYADRLQASGRSARWNSDEREVIYTSSSIALACLENIVHRSQLGLSAQFRLLNIMVPDELMVRLVEEDDLPQDWQGYGNMRITQTLGDQWIEENRYAILKVPSSIVPAEYNYLLNPHHMDFKKIRLVRTEPFVFDTRIKR